MLDELELPYEETDIRGGRHRRRPRTGGKGGRSGMAMVLIVVVFAGLVGGGWWGVNKVRGFLTAADYDGPGTGQVVIEVHAGDGATAIGNTLYDEGVVKSAKAFVEAASDNTASLSIQPGHYKLRKQMKATLALAALLDLDNKVVSKVTLPEGLTMEKTFAALSKSMGIPVSEFENAAKDPIALGVPDFWFNRTDKRQPARTVEGFLYPATYDFDPGTTAADALKVMIAQFLQVAEEVGFVDQAQAKGISPYEALVVSSLVQGEGIPSDFSKVARVVYNRLNKPMPLEFDSTSNYWRELHGQQRKDNLSDAELADPHNPYRTYQQDGLPPGPIDSPSKEALEAAVNPAKGPWLYFVKIDKAGNSAFTDDYDQHLRNIETAKRNGAY